MLRMRRMVPTESTLGDKTGTACECGVPIDDALVPARTEIHAIGLIRNARNQDFGNLWKLEIRR